MKNKNQCLHPYNMILKDKIIDNYKCIDCGYKRPYVKTNLKTRPIDYMSTCEIGADLKIRMLYVLKSKGADINNSINDKIIKIKEECLT